MLFDVIRGCIYLENISYDLYEICLSFPVIIYNQYGLFDVKQLYAKNT